MIGSSTPAGSMSTWPTSPAFPACDALELNEEITSDSADYDAAQQYQACSLPDKYSSCSRCRDYDFFVKDSIPIRPPHPAAYTSNWPALREFLHRLVDRNPTQRWMAAGLLKDMADDAITPALAQTLIEDPSPDCRSEAAQSLGYRGDIARMIINNPQRAENNAKPMSESKRRLIVARAEKELQFVVGALKQALGDPDDKVACSARLRLQYLDPSFALSPRAHELIGPSVIGPNGNLVPMVKEWGTTGWRREL